MLAFRVHNESLYFLDVTKPKPVEEWERIQKLKEAKEKFRSKHFWNDSSKFDSFLFQYKNFDDIIKVTT